jgi:hypothetical protein
MAAPKKPGGNAGKGRVKGVPNRITRDLKAMILGALDDAGGQEWLREQMDANPVAFMTLLGKVLPMAMEHSGELIVNRVCYLTEAELMEIAAGGRAGNDAETDTRH